MLEVSPLPLFQLPGRPEPAEPQGVERDQLVDDPHLSCPPGDDLRRELDRLGEPASALLLVRIARAGPVIAPSSNSGANRPDPAPRVRVGPYV